MLRRPMLALLGGMSSALALAALVSCGEERSGLGATPVPPTDAGTDVALVGENPPAPDDSGVSPGDPCGIDGGLQPGAKWPLRGGCTTRAGWSPAPGPTGAQIAWSSPLAGGASSPAVDSAGTAWVGTRDGDVVAVSGGSVRWAYRTGGPVRSSPAIDAFGHVIVASDDGRLYSLQAKNAPSDQDGGAIDPGDSGVSYPTPTRVFALPIGPTPSSPVIGGDGAIYVGTTDGKLLRVRGDGAVIDWSVVTNDTVGSSPALGQDGTVYVGSSDHRLYAVSEPGAVKWSLDLGAAVGSPAVGGDGTIYVGTGDGKLHAVGADGVERWTYATDGAIIGTPAVYAGTVYVGSEDKSLHAVSTVDGKRRWAYATLGAVATPVIDGEGTVYVGSADLRLYAITPTGTLFYALGVKGAVRGAPALAGASLVVATDTALVSASP